MMQPYYYGHGTGSRSSTASCDNMYDNVNGFQDQQQLLLIVIMYAMLIKLSCDKMYV